MLNWLTGGGDPQPEASGGDEIGALLPHWRDPVARDRLFSLIYPELRRAAEIRMRFERPDHTLQPTALVNEVFLQLVRQREMRWQNRAHFLAMASEMMRRILVDHARARGARRRDGGVRVPLEPDQFVTGQDFEEIILLDDLLTRLARKNARLAQVVELRYFGGLSFQEVGEVLRIGERTAKRDWQMARAWLYTAMVPEGPNDARTADTDQTAS
ncbi:MAG: ECF-type sigma factor [Bryobacteraceae bacterium]